MSTARFNNAGAVGTGTTIDNMASRLKSWINLATSSTAPVARQSLNVSSLVDNAAGDQTVNYTAAFANTTYVATPSTAMNVNAPTTNVAAGISTGGAIASTAPAVYTAAGTRFASSLSGQGAMNDTTYAGLMTVGDLA